MRGVRVLLLVGILGMVVCTWTLQLNAQPEDILLDDHSVFKSRERSPAAFRHMYHISNGIECKTCHHRFKGGKNILDETELQEGAEGIKCSSCHKQTPGFRFAPDLDPTKRNLQQAFHRQCMGCHRQVSQEGKKAGPVTCGECHPWKKKASQS
ncbi:MAG: class cytochrome family protein [Deltaproteobacteria bacterium]|nr:class cytochrome family protein [Deltaproteobacteria bacterium]